MNIIEVLLKTWGIILQDGDLSGFKPVPIATVHFSGKNRQERISKHLRATASVRRSKQASKQQTNGKIATYR